MVFGRPHLANMECKASTVLLLHVSVVHIAIISGDFDKVSVMISYIFRWCS